MFAENVGAPTFKGLLEVFLRAFEWAHL